ncbi:hypothetical protein Zmor_005696 [Zophobas morio]|uniref:Uncharacterized protein n=1 Tax=Zophobas morio TaxID=2755281 RepID=A0AA38MKY1_9CUCU|nr:hypothetical protein Zmor_005696 [Zophobas morio]
MGEAIHLGDQVEMVMEDIPLAVQEEMEMEVITMGAMEQMGAMGRMEVITMGAMEQMGAMGRMEAMEAMEAIRIRCLNFVLFSNLVLRLIHASHICK